MKGFGTVAEAFESAFELVTQEPPADVGPSTALVSVKEPLATARSAATQAIEQLALM